MNKLPALLGIMSILTIPSVFAIDFGPLEEIMQAVFHIGSFVWVTDVVSATKFAIFVVIFAILYAVLHTGFLKDKPGLLGNKKVSVVISFALAALTVIFIPNNVAESIGVVYSAIFAVLLAGVPAGLLAWLGIHMTSKDTVPKPVKHGVRLLIALMILSLFSGIGAQYGLLAIIPFTLRRGDD